MRYISASMQTTTPRRASFMQIWGFNFVIMPFARFFSFEWLVRFGAFKNKLDCCKDRWFQFDTFLLALMVLETWVFPFVFSSSSGGPPTGMLKLLRLARLARLVRIMRELPELVAMLKGIRAAGRAVGSALLILVFLIYIFAIMMHMALQDETDEFLKARFNRLLMVMFTLLIDGTFLDSIGTLATTLLVKRLYIPWLLLMMFVLASALTVMNMLIGVLCEMVSAVAQQEKEDNAIQMVKDSLLQMLKSLDSDGSGMISRNEIEQALYHQDALHVFEDLQVDFKHLLDMLDMFFDADSNGELSVQEIMELILMMRGDRAPTMNDVLTLQGFLLWKLLRKDVSNFGPA
eukprot:gnl/TRDRNA2_/TRDRNA2_173881_c1_seq1.p1 gnl/TRDRNA2_/TRDRNA2_173881_c1~~gnl/TRDRNA2_/TRDRNA2_173881_c1_seq1.p1  ORF type:complete len:347 (-),score=66.27 gnl/TRDRNA2_/TRDRNA2_173881_c1_seq1:57-1097(-)